MSKSFLQYILPVILLPQLTWGYPGRIEFVSNFDIYGATEEKIRTTYRRSKRDVSIPVIPFASPRLTVPIVNATIGTPPQSLQMLVTIANAYFVVLSAAVCQSTDPCPYGSFNSSASSTFTRPSSLNTSVSETFNLTITEGQSALGKLSRDDVKVGNVSLDSFEIALATNTTENWNSYAGNVMGLGYAGSVNTQTTNYTNLPLQLYIDGTVNIIGYSIWYDSNDKSTGNIAFGAIDTQKFNGTLGTSTIAFDTLDLAYNYPIIPALGLLGLPNSSSNQTTVLYNEKVAAVVDTGFSGLTIPSDALNQTAAFLGASMNSSSGLLWQPKTDFKNDSVLQIELTGTSIQIPVWDLVRPDARRPFDLSDEQWDSNYYYSIDGILGNAYVLGVPYFCNSYNLFDFTHNQIGIAPLIVTSSSDLKLVGSGGAAGAQSTYGNNSTNATNATTSQGAFGNTVWPRNTSVDISVGVGIGVGVPVILGILAVILLRQRKRRRSLKVEQESEKDGIDKYKKSELPALDTRAAGKAGAEMDTAPVGLGSPGKLEMGTSERRAEMLAERQTPQELPGSVPVSHEMDSGQSAGGSGLPEFDKTTDTT